MEQIERIPSGKRMPWWKWLLLLIAGFMTFAVVMGFAEIPSVLDEDYQLPLWLYIPLCLIGAGAVLGVYTLWRRIDGYRRAPDLPKRKLHASLWGGFGIGALYFVLVTGCIALLGGYRIGSVRWDTVSLVKCLFQFLVVGVGEEVLFRGIVFRMMDERWGTLVALILSSLLFGFLHITNDNATVWSSVAITVEAGLLLGAAYKWSGSLWLPIGIHWSWNFFQGPVFGFAVSGNETYSLVRPLIDGPVWMTGGDFGAEASVPALILGLAVTILFFYTPSRSTDTIR